MCADINTHDCVCLLILAQVFGLGQSDLYSFLALPHHGGRPQASGHWRLRDGALLEEPVEANRTGPRPKKKGNKVAERKIEAQMYQFNCLTCTKSFRDSSNKKALEHKLLILGAGCAHCADPQIAPHQIKSLMLIHEMCQNNVLCQNNCKLVGPWFQLCSVGLTGPRAAHDPWLNNAKQNASHSTRQLCLTYPTNGKLNCHQWQVNTIKW